MKIGKHDVSGVTGLDARDKLQLIIVLVVTNNVFSHELSLESRLATLGASYLQRFTLN